jgi:hypothetical protein
MIFNLGKTMRLKSKTRSHHLKSAAAGGQRAGEKLSYDRVGHQGTEVGEFGVIEANSPPNYARSVLSRCLYCSAKPLRWR